MVGENLDLGGEQDDQPSPNGRSERRFVGVQFDCCGVYIRVYVNQGGTAYEGHCPRCSRPVRIRIGTGGTECRFFRCS
jgi:hypothetical protein